MTQIQALSHQPLPGALVLTLIENTQQDRRVRAVELLGNGSRLRLSFTRDNAFEAVFSEETLKVMQDLLNRVDSDPSVLVVPELILKMHGFALGSARVISAVSEDGGRLFTIRFEQVFGNLMMLFSKSVDVANALTMQSRTLAMAASRSVYLPLFEFAEFLENAHDSEMFGDRSRLYRHLSETRDRIRELEQYHDALISMVDGPEHADLNELPPPGTRLQ